MNFEKIGKQILARYDTFHGVVYFDGIFCSTSEWYEFLSPEDPLRAGPSHRHNTSSVKKIK